MLRRLLAVLAMALVLITPALAADWVVLRLRGDVQVQVEDAWIALKRGDIVTHDQLVRTLGNGYAELQRNKEVVTLGNNTEIRIQQDAETGFTTVLQDFGRVEVDAEAKRVKHFEVRTPYLAAVVKGTHFVVNSDNAGAIVSVDRGSVAVQSVATDRSTLITVGQTATVKRKTDLVVGGLGPWPAVVEPGVSRPMVVASLGGGLDAALPQGSGTTKGLSSPPILKPAGFDAGPDQSGVVRMKESTDGGQRVTMAATSTALLGGFAASRPTAAKVEPEQPVSLGVVMLGALLGALMGGLALMLRRGL